ncbi:MAG TPA: cytidine deaminase [Terriglobia bacterium]|nr:cytidine deaminase [Terriglobia bacterium]
MTSAENLPPDDRALAKLIPQWGAGSRASLARVLSDVRLRGRIPAAEVEPILDAERKTAGELILDLLPVAQLYARAPTSNYRVGAVAHGVSGSVYFGANLEVPRQMLGFSVHAEQSAVTNAFAHQEPGVRALAVTATPCGHCRQFLNELAGAATLEVHVKGGAAARLASLLPSSFGPDNLGVKDRIFKAAKWELEPAAGTSSDDLSSAALEAARRSYAPYSHSPSGVAVQASNNVYIGSYLENAAFNPSLSPLPAALVSLMMGREETASITAVALVEIENGTISQVSATQAVLGALAPAVQLKVVAARVRS